MEPVIEDIQAGYNKIASAYSALFWDEHAQKPMDQEMLKRFAREINGKGLVCDMGCGPGQTAGYLHDACGIEKVIGIDLSPRFVEEAKKYHPNIDFFQGNMLKLEQADNSWAGVTAFYCLIHIPHAQIVEALSELKRVLIPGGVLLLTFHVGKKILHIDSHFNERVSMDFIFFTPAEMEGYLRSAGFERIEAIVRKPYRRRIEYQSKRAYMFAYKPENTL